MTNEIESASTMSMNDSDFLDYCYNHCRVADGLFEGKELYRLVVLAGHFENARYWLENIDTWYEFRPIELDPIIEQARDKLNHA